jgi:hypothetical protein
MKAVTKNEFIQVIEETRALLKENGEWRGRYAGYAEEIRKNIHIIKSVRSSFHEWSPLKVYLTITQAKKAKHSVTFNLRYLGQRVADLTGNVKEGLKLSTKGYKGNNLEYFDCDICLSAADWLGEDAKRFRMFFKKGPRRADANKGNEEHRLESLLLTEFSKIKDKKIRYIKPVTIGRVRFSMPTPISASHPTALGYNPKYRGAIDILARTGTGGKATHLCIMELKDENTKREPPKEVMRQAIAYATFIRELLRSGAGAKWWQLFGFGGEKVPEPLELYAICVMPSSDNNDNDYSFGNMELNIERDIIKLHYIYFDREYFSKENKIRIKPGDATIGVVE